MKLAYARFMQQMTDAAIHVQGATAMLAGPSTCPAAACGPRSSCTRRRCASPAAPTRSRATSSASGCSACPAEARADQDIPFRDLAKGRR